MLRLFFIVLCMCLGQVWAQPPALMRAVGPFLPAAGAVLSHALHTATSSDYPHPGMTPGLAQAWRSCSLVAEERTLVHAVHPYLFWEETRASHSEALRRVFDKRVVLSTSLIGEKVTDTLFPFGFFLRANDPGAIYYTGSDIGTQRSFDFRKKHTSSLEAYLKHLAFQYPFLSPGELMLRTPFEGRFSHNEIYFRFDPSNFWVTGIFYDRERLQEADMEKHFYRFCGVLQGSALLCINLSQPGWTNKLKELGPGIQLVF